MYDIKENIRENYKEIVDKKVESEVKKNWEAIKLNEKGSGNSVLSGVPSSLPTMLKSWRIQEKVRGIGFQWAKKEGYIKKMEEERIAQYGLLT